MLLPSWAFPKSGASRSPTASNFRDSTARAPLIFGNALLGTADVCRLLFLGPSLWRDNGDAGDEVPYRLCIMLCNLTVYGLLEKQSVPDWSAMAEDCCPFQAASAVEDSDSEAMIARNY